VICYSVLRCVAVCCSVLQYVAVCCSSGAQVFAWGYNCKVDYVCDVQQRVGVCWIVLQCVAVCCSVLQLVAAFCSVYPVATRKTLRGAATPRYTMSVMCSSVLQCVAVCCSVLQCCSVLSVANRKLLHGTATPRQNMFSSYGTHLHGFGNSRAFHMSFIHMSS